MTMRLAACLAVASVSIAADAPPQRWEPVALVTATERARGLDPGGEGCQYPCTIVADPIDGGVVLFATDVGGVYRSDDGARRWHTADLGMKADGAIAFAFDPCRRERVLMYATGSGNRQVQADGVYLSVDGGERWSQVLSTPKIDLSHDAVDCVAFDPASRDEVSGGCARAYVALQGCPEVPDALYRSDDGGVTWAVVAHADAYGGAGAPTFVACARDGALLIAGPHGAWRSEDRGGRFARVLEGSIAGLCVVGDVAFAARGAELLRSDDGGRSFTPIAQRGVKRFKRLRVSAADPRRMATQDADGNARMVSHDGGATWTASRYVHDAAQFVPEGIRTGYADRCYALAWHPRDPQVCWAIGPGDQACRSDDGGLTFRACDNGINDVMIGGLFNFSAEDPDVLYFGSQDYNGGLTTDGGRTWTFVNLSISNTRDAVRAGGDDSDPWGWVYGGYSPDGRVIFGGNHEYQGTGEDLWISFDGGRTSERKAKGLTGVQVSFSDPRATDVLFCWSMRSADRGRSWALMDGCDGVFGASAGADHALYGAHGTSVVRSTDHGETWTAVCALPKPPRDVAYDHVRDRWWIACDNALWRCDAGDAPTKVDRLPTDHFGHGFLATTVAVDPIDPRIVYAGALGTGLWVQRDATVARSLDGGTTWERLTGDPRYLADGWVTGAQMTSALRVHPRTRWLYAATCCFGWWRFPPPPAAAVGKPVTDHRYEPALPATPVDRVPDRSAAAGSRHIVRDFARGGFDYPYGSWKAEQLRSDAGGLVIDAREDGGAGAVLGGVPIAPGGQRRLVVRLKPLAGNEASSIVVNLLLGGGRGTRALSIDVRSLPTDRFSAVAVALPEPADDLRAVDQVQVQGAAWGAGARALRVTIESIATE